MTSALAELPTGEYPVLMRVFTLVLILLLVGLRATLRASEMPPEAEQPQPAVNPISTTNQPAQIIYSPSAVAELLPSAVLVVAKVPVPTNHCPRHLPRSS